MHPFYFRVGDGLSRSGEGAETVYGQEVKLHAPGFVKDKQLKDKVLKLVHELLQALESTPFTADYKEETIKHQGISFKVTCFLDKVRIHTCTHACANDAVGLVGQKLHATVPNHRTTLGNNRENLTCL